MRVSRFWIIVAVVAWAWSAQAGSGGSAPQAGGFRGKDPAASQFEAVALEHDDSPLTVAVASTGRDERGVTITLRVTNTDEAPVSRHVLGVWVVAADGLLRGSQQARQSKALAPGESRTIDVALRLIAVQAGDTLVAAVQEAAGATAWKRDPKILLDEVRAAVPPRR
jgi:hypothetical protein